MVSLRASGQSFAPPGQAPRGRFRVQTDFPIFINLRQLPHRIKNSQNLLWTWPQLPGYPPHLKVYIPRPAQRRSRRNAPCQHDFSEPFAISLSLLSLHGPSRPARRSQAAGDASTLRPVTPASPTGVQFADGSAMSPANSGTRLSAGQTPTLAPPPSGPPAELSPQDQPRRRRWPRRLPHRRLPTAARR